MTEDDRQRRPRDKLRRRICSSPTTCGDPECGLHIVPERQSGQPICEIVIGKEQLLGLLRYIHDEGLDL